MPPTQRTEHANADAPAPERRHGWYRWQGPAAFVALFALLVVVRFEVIDSPPYYDYAVGLWAEANFLVETGFDYHRLWYEESHTLDPEGGPRSYMTSVLPTAVAVLMLVLPTARSTLIAYHLFVFACAAAALTLVYAVLRPHCGRIASFATVLAVATTPVFSVQIDMASMEMPLIAAALATVWCVRREHYLRAACLGMLAFLIKPTGLVVCLAMLLYLGVRWLVFRGGERGIADVARRGMLASGVVVGVQMAILVWSNSFDRLIRPSNGPLLYVTRYWFPDLLWIMAIGLLACFAIVAVWSIRATSRSTAASRWQRGREVVRRALTVWPTASCGAIVLVGMLLAIQTVFFIPRYMALVVPFFYLVTANILFSLPRLTAPLVVVLVGIAGFNLANWNGRFYIDHLTAQQGLYGERVGSWLARETSHYERSHEYLAEHRSNIAAMRFLDEEGRDLPIFSGHPYTYFLALPRLGYVERPLSGYATVPFRNAQTAFEPVENVLRDPPREAIFIWVANGWYLGISDMRVPAPALHDEVIYRDDLPSPLLIYVKRFAGNESRVRHWYDERLWPVGRSTIEARLVRRARAGTIDPAVEFSSVRLNDRIGFGLGSLSPQSQKLFMGAWWLQEDRLDRALREMLAALQIMYEQSEAIGVATGKYPFWDWLDVSQPPPAEAEQAIAWHLERGFDAFAQRQEKLAAGHWLAVLRLKSPEIGDALEQFARGEHDFRAGRLAEAAEAFNRSRESAPDFAWTHNYLGLIQNQLGQTAASMEHFERATRLDPTFAEAHNNRGIMLAQGERWDEAAVQFERAIACRPNFAAAAINLREVHRLKPRVEQNTP